MSHHSVLQFFFLCHCNVQLSRISFLYLVPSCAPSLRSSCFSVSLPILHLFCYNFAAFLRELLEVFWRYLRHTKCVQLTNKTEHMYRVGMFDFNFGSRRFFQLLRNKVWLNRIKMKRTLTRKDTPYVFLNDWIVHNRVQENRLEDNKKKRHRHRQQCLTYRVC